MEKDSYTLDTVLPSNEPIPNGPGTEGCGEGVEYGGDHFYYTVGRRIPKNKVVALRAESNYCGRVHGDVEYILVAWNGTSFTVLDRSYPGVLQKSMAVYRGCEPSKAIRIKQEQLDERRRRYESLPKCSGCGEAVLLIDNKQRAKECLTCMDKRLKKEKKHAV